MASEHGMTIEARSATYADAGMGGTAPKTKKPAAVKRATGKAKKGAPLRTIDLFCGAGGITEGFRQAGYVSLYGNDVMPEAIETFKLNHPEVPHPEPTHYASGRANFRGGGTMTFQLTDTDRERLLPCVTVGEAIGDLLRRKDKALAEAAAILVLRKKLNAYWGNDSEDN